MFHETAGTSLQPLKALVNPSLLPAPRFIVDLSLQESLERLQLLVRSRFPHLTVLADPIIEFDAVRAQLPEPQGIMPGYVGAAMAFPAPTNQAGAWHSRDLIADDDGALLMWQQDCLHADPEVRGRAQDNIDPTGVPLLAEVWHWDQFLDHVGAQI